MLRTNEPISTKLGTKHLWLRKIQAYYEGLQFFQGEITTKQRKHIDKIKQSSFRTTGPNSAQLGAKHPYVKETISKY